MPKLYLAEDEYAALWYDRRLHAVRHQIKMPVPCEPMKALLSRGLELLILTSACKWLSDDRCNGLLPLELDSWARGHWRPTAAKAGWKYWAIVPPVAKIPQAELSMQSEMCMQEGVTAQLFSSVRKAERWLLELDTQS